MKQGFWKMGEFVETGPAQAAITGVRILERRAEMAADCQCLAAWDDERECICNKTVEVPLSPEKLAEAKCLVDRLDENKRRFARIQSHSTEEVDCFVFDDTAKNGRDYDRDRNHGHHMSESYYCFTVALPKKLVEAALTTERRELIEKLCATGIVSVDSANIRAVLK